MKKAFYGFAALAAASTAGVSVSAFRYEEKIRPNVKVGTVEVGGLTREEAAFKLRTWWEGEKVKTVKLKSGKLQKALPELKPSELGVTFDDAASVAAAPLQGFVDNAQEIVAQSQEPEQVLPPIFKPNGLLPDRLVKVVKEAAGKPRPARVGYVKGNIIHKPEVSSLQLEMDAVYESAIEALQGDRVMDVPLEEAPKHVPDEELSKIREVVASFSTRFSSGNRPRSSNIRLASSKIDGLVLAPGDQFSFNGTVGQRTIKSGFKVAGVYINGRHDTGVGGGICQVSTTLYNAALMSNLKIVKRTNHSLPVPYVPVGRDATVNWGAQDLVFENDMETPVAINAVYEPGRLTFRVLGVKQSGLSVKIERSGLRSWRSGTKVVRDNRLPPGSRRVIESGSAGYSCSTARLVYQDGKLVKKESLGRSLYGGGATIVAVGPPRVATPKPAPVPPLVPPPGGGGLGAPPSDFIP